MLSIRYGIYSFNVLLCFSTVNPRRKNFDNAIFS
nr:MAG TPA: hypothetical protein [Crassvirales sp.]